MPAMLGMSSENEIPAFPWGANWYFGPSRAELGLMNAAR